MADKSEQAGASAADRDSHPHDVFISYSSQNKVVADTVCAVLELNGVRCWMAPRDITPGAEWAGSIIHAINDTRAFVLIFSSFANTSLQVKREVERAANRGVPIIPFRLEDIPANETLEFFISTPHWLDALSPPLETHAEHLSRVVERLLGDTKPKLTRARRRAGAAEAVAETVEDAQEAAAAAAPPVTPEIPPAAAVPVQPTAPPPAPAAPPNDTAATIAAAQALAAAPAAAAPVPGFQPNTSPGEAPVTAPIAQTRPPSHPMEPVWATGIGAALAVLPMLASVSPAAGWSLLTLFALPVTISLFRLSFVGGLKAFGLGVALFSVYCLATGIGWGMATLLSHGAPPGPGQVFFVGLVAAFSIASGSYASLILWGNQVTTAPAVRMAMIYTGILSAAGAVLAATWAALHTQDMRMGPVDIILALPWVVAYGAGFFAVSAATLNPLLSAAGRRNVTEQASARAHKQVTEPRSQGAFLGSLGLVVGLFVLMFTLVAAANAGNNSGPGPALNTVEPPNGGKDPNGGGDPNGGDPNVQDPPPYEAPPPQQDNYDANPPVEQQGGSYQGQ